MTQEEAEIPTLQQYSHSLKISDTAKGVRFDVHVWANSSDIAVDQAFALYTGAVKRAADSSIPMADNGELAK